MLNTDEFRTEALQFTEKGYYTKHAKGTLGSKRYWDEMSKRCLFGYKRPGAEWIPGYYYFYLNFSPISLTQVSEEALKSDLERIQANRVTGFPEFRDAGMDYFLYLDDAEKSGEHAVLFKSRGVGYSFSSASMCNRNYFLIPGSKSFVFAESDEYLQGDGILTKTWNMMSFIDQNTAWSKRRQVKNDNYHKRASRKVNINGIDTEKGFLSEIMGVPIGNDLDKTVRGKRGKLVVWEESGSNKYLLSGWMIALQSMAEGRFTFGLMLAGGTGGSSKTDMMSIETLFKKPKGYRVHAVTNKWEPGHESELTGYFWPAHFGRKGHMDKDGNSCLESAAEEILKNRKLTAEEGDPTSLIQLTAEEPLTPSEAMLRVNYSIFNLNMVREVIAQLESNSSINNSAFIGRLTITTNGEVIWKPDDTVRPIMNYPITPADDFNGGTVIWEHPIRNSDNEIPYGLYIAATDPYDDDKTDPTKRDSLGSTFVMNVLTGRIVAEYTARPRFADDYYEQVRRLLKYYNAVCNYEQNKKGMYQYFNTMSATHMLCDNPQILRDMDMVKVEMSGNRLKGTYVNDEINKYGRELIKKWSESPAYGEDPNTGIKNIHKIKSLPLLYEMLYWEPDRNADRISALGLLMILKLERFKIVVDMEKKVRTLADDPLFTKLYTGRGIVTGDLNSYNNTAFFDEAREVYDLDIK